MPLGYHARQFCSHDPLLVNDDRGRMRDASLLTGCCFVPYTKPVNRLAIGIGKQREFDFSQFGESGQISL